MMPKAVLFDAGNTLIWLDHPYIVRVLREHGVETTMEALMEAEYGAKLQLDELARNGKLDDRTRGMVFFDVIFRHVGVHESAVSSLAQLLFARHAEKNLWGNVRERTGEASVPVVYNGTVPDPFREGREVIVTVQRDAGGTFVGEKDSLITKCPSKFTKKDQ